MGKRQAKRAGGLSGIFGGVAITVGVYIAGILLFAWMIVSAILPAENAFIVLAAWMLVSTACGGLAAKRVKNFKPLPACLLQGCIFIAIAIGISYLFWEGPVWSVNNLKLLACGLTGSLLPGVFNGREGRRRKGKNRW